ncbi:MAG: hypothetical protein RLY13_401 [Actinomycetota bacterium]|jgi:CP family cyanate transporter-like MFS transporter
MAKKFGALGLLALMFIAVVLRTPVAPIGPLLPEIVSALAMTPAMTSALNSAPVLCFGLGAFLSPWLVRRVGVNTGVFYVLVVLALSLAARMIFGYAGLLVGTIGAGLAIAVANVLLPTVVRTNFKNHVAMVTGIYTTLLAVSASAAATLAVPSSALLGGWSQALAIWLAPTVLAILLWLPQVRATEQHVPKPAAAAIEEKAAVYRSPLTWAIVIFFGLQSLGFYSILGWLPTALISVGATPEAAGGYLGFATAIGIPFGLLVSAVLKRFESQSFWAVGTSLLSLSGFVLYALQMQQTYSEPLIIWACLLLGLGMSATFPISLALISTRASSQAQTTELSTLAQGLGYLISAVGTFAMGLLANFTGTWFAGMAFLVVLTAIQAISGLYAGRPGSIPLRHLN